MNTAKPVMRGHLSGCVLIAFPVKHFVGYFNIEIYLQRRDTCHEGTPVRKGHLSGRDTCQEGTPVRKGHLSGRDTCQEGTPVMKGHLS